MPDDAETRQSEQWSATNLGIIKFQEGHFTNGVQDGLGRVAEAGTNWFTYTGYFANSTVTGQGIATKGQPHTSDFKYYQGEYGTQANFPGTGTTLNSPETAHLVKDLTRRTDLFQS